MINRIDLEIIKTEEDILIMLDDLLERRDNEWWNKFYGNKEKPIPFFKNIPDENLNSYIDKDLLNRGKVLDVGCGNGRNSIYLAKNGFKVTAIDFAESSIEWGKQLSKKENIEIDFLCQSIFDLKCETESFDLIYDGGCFHHIKPHRRNQYLNTVINYLKPNGYFAMTCFNLKGGANISDYDVYKDKSMHGGLGFSEHKLKTILEQYFEIIEFREMKDSNDENKYGQSFLWTVLMRKK